MSKPKSIAANSIWYLIYQVFNVIFPFITTLYAGRILLPEGVGKVISAQNIATYFALLAFLGIPTYGRREIAKVRDDKEALSKIYSELMVINAASTFVFCVLYVGLIFIVPDFRSQLPLYLVVGGAIALNFLNNSWFFEGLEDFKFISIRNIIFKAGSFILLVLLVHNVSDYLWYALITVLGTAGNYILNVLYAPRYVKFSLSGLDLTRHMSPVFALLAVNIAIELYSQIDVTMIRFIVGEKNVAYYSYANGINKILQQVINTFTIVVVPRLTLYFKDSLTAEFNALLSKTLNAIFVLALPMICGIEVVASTAIIALYGPAYADSVPVLRLLAVLLIISPVGYLLGSRVLLVAGKEKLMARCVWAGAVVNIIGNAILIPLFFEKGAAAASILSELCVAVVYIFLGKRYFKIAIDWSEVWKVLLGCILMGACARGCMLITDILLLRLVIQVIAGVAVYGIVLKVTSEKLMSEYLTKFFSHRR